MNKIKITLLFLIISIQISYPQIEDIFKKVPGLSDVFEEAVTTSIKDAYPTAYWLGGVNDKVSITGGVKFSENLGAGYYKYKFNTFCLRAGTYAPTEGAGYVAAPLKGAKAKLIKSILSRYPDHPEIDQKDVQRLIWGIEAGQKFSNYPPDFQFRIQPLLKPEDIAAMEVDLKEIGYDLLPDDVKNVLYLYKDIRYKLSDVNSTYEDIEQLAVRTGVAPLGKGSKNIPAGTWTLVGDNVYIRCFPEGYSKSNIEIYIPADVKIKKDNSGYIISMDDGTTKIDFSYESGSTKFKTAVIKNTYTNEEFTIDNTITHESSLKKDADDFIKLVKKSFGKKKAKRLTEVSSKTITQLKSIENSLNQLLTDKTGLRQSGYEVSVNALNNFIGSLETGTIKGGGLSHKTGLGNVSGLVFAPANTSQQRLGNGGPEGGSGNEGSEGDPEKNKEKEKEKPCKVTVSLHQVPENELPKPDWVYAVNADIFIEGDDEKCEAEEIVFTLYDVGQERGRCINDKEKMDDSGYDLVINSGYTNPDLEIISSLSAKKKLSGKSQSVQVNITCNDYGAYGKLKASVKVKGNWYEADGDGTPDKYITIPLDLNDNKIADSWEKQNKVNGKPGEWDEDPIPSGQARSGDGMTNYEEYRGFFVSDGDVGTEHVRCDPMQKEIFVIDNDKIFDVASWKAASGIKAYWLTAELVYGSKGGGELDQSYRWVNFCGGHAQGVKYAVNLRKIPTVNDPYSLCPGTAYDGCNAGSPVKYAKLTIVLPERTKQWLIDTKDTITAWLNRFPKEKNLYVEGTGVSTKSLKQFVDAINNPKKFEEIMNFHINATVIHEVGHALGVPHHGGGVTTKMTTGDHSCPMRYLEYLDAVFINQSWLQKVLNLIDTDGNVIVTYTKWKFCKKKDNCWKQLDANDR